MGGNGLDSSGSEQRQIEGYCERGNEISGSKLATVGYMKFFKNDTA